MEGYGEMTGIDHHRDEMLEIRFQPVSKSKCVSFIPWMSFIDLVKYPSIFVQ